MKVNKVPPSKRMLPVIFLVDVSDSMRHGNKLDSINNAMREVLEELETYGNEHTDIAIYTNGLIFGGRNQPVRWMYEDEMQPLAVFEWEVLKPEYKTPLGEAYDELDAKLSRDEFMTSPHGCMAPVLILMTDGVPTNSKKAEEGLQKLRTNSWFNSAERMAIGLDMDPMDTDFLEEFIKGSPNGKVYLKTSEATELIKSIQRIVVSTTVLGATRLAPNPVRPRPEDDEDKEENGAGSTVPPTPSPSPGPIVVEDEDDDDVTEP